MLYPGLYPVAATWCAVSDCVTCHVSPLTSVKSADFNNYLCTICCYMLMRGDANMKTCYLFWRSWCCRMLLMGLRTLSDDYAVHSSPVAARYSPERSVSTPSRSVLRAERRHLLDFQNLKQKLEKLMTSSGTVVSDRKLAPKDSKCKYARSATQSISHCYSTVMLGGKCWKNRSLDRQK